MKFREKFIHTCMKICEIVKLLCCALKSQGFSACVTSCNLTLILALFPRSVLAVFSELHFHLPVLGRMSHFENRSQLYRKKHAYHFVTHIEGVLHSVCDTTQLVAL